MPSKIPISPKTDRSFQWISPLGLIAGCMTAAIFILRAPFTEPTGDVSLQTAYPGSFQSIDSEESLRLVLPSPPRLGRTALESRDPIEFTVLLPPFTLPSGLFHEDNRLLADPAGARLRIEPGQLTWGANSIHLEGADRFGQPIDRAWTLLITDTESPDGFTLGGLMVRLTSEGFTDDDDLLDDFSSIARQYVLDALADIGPVDIGPVTASNFRVGRTRVVFRPQAGYLEAHLYLDLVHFDAEVESVISLTHIPVHRMWLDLQLDVNADPRGRPLITVRQLEPHIDLVRSGEGAVAWVLDHAAWVVEITGELMTEGPIREALTRALDQALARWVDRFHFETMPPLRRVAMTADYRFDRLRVDENGLTAVFDFRLSCDHPRPEVLGRIITERHRRFPELSPIDPERAAVQIGIHHDALNAALDSLWRCEALDSIVSFGQASRQFPLAIPIQVETHFDLPPVLQSDRDGGMVLSVGDAQIDLDYGDARYHLTANAVLPIYLRRGADGRYLEVGFDPDADRTLLYTDCRSVDGARCLDNPLFDRLAWLAIPLLPPIGATIPLPDVRLRADSGDAVMLDLVAIHWHPHTGLIDLLGSYELSLADP